MTEDLVAALRLRADGFEQAAAKDGLTLRRMERDGTIGRAGERIDRAMDALDRAGLLAKN